MFQELCSCSWQLFFIERSCSFGFVGKMGRSKYDFGPLTHYSDYYFDYFTGFTWEHYP